jgi:hypothetical protein
MLKLLLASAALLTACAAVTAGGDGADPETPPAIARGEPFRLHVGQERVLAEPPGEIDAPGRTTVRFVAVAGDSRCPRDVTCVWAGDAEIEIALRREEGPTEGGGTEKEAAVHLHTAGGARMPREAQALGLTLRLEALDPYPETSRRIEQEEYTATLVIP